MKGSAIILVIILILSGCSTGKSFTEKPYICYEVFPTTNGKTVHRFANLTITKGREFDLDSICCHPFDTVIIKDYRRGPFRKKLTVFINYKN